MIQPETKRSIPYRALLLFLIHTIIREPTQAQTSTEGANGQLPVMHIERIRDPITLDGRVDEPIWEEVAMLPLIQYGPYYHGEFAERSELRVAYDDRYIYFSCRCYDSDPSGIRVTSLKRDAWNSSFDQIGLLLDTFNDKENHLAFIISAAGVRTDAALSKDGDGIQMSWDTFWDAKTHQSESGWSAEGRIPLSSLKFNTVDGKVVMGLSFYRFIARTRETHLFPDIPPNWGQYSWTKPSRAQEVEFTGIQSKNPLYITPYVLTGLGQRFELNEKESAYDRVDDPTYDIGLDLKYGLTNNLTLDLTVNTDFAQV
ncbi:MAG: carbohydrate binding family 9 domain-containing protein, partial [Bacteroidetes bacterium]|nr:carbohydrate binding family 9 domain-containing protein [Bacteroidota bacterium]